MGPISYNSIQLGITGCGWVPLHVQTNKEQRTIMFPLTLSIQHKQPDRSFSCTYPPSYCIAPTPNAVQSLTGRENLGLIPVEAIANVFR